MWTCFKTNSWSWWGNIVQFGSVIVVVFFYFVFSCQFILNCMIRDFKGELRPEISLLHVKVLIMIKAKNNVFLWYVQCFSCTRRSKTKILTTRAPPSWIEFDVMTSQRLTQIASECVMLLESISWDSQTIFLGFYKRSINAWTWKSTITSHIQE